MPGRLPLVHEGPHRSVDAREVRQPDVPSKLLQRVLGLGLRVWGLGFRV